MSPEEDSHIRRFKWHIVIIGVAVAFVMYLALFTTVFDNKHTAAIRDLVFLLGSLVFLVALLTLLSRISGIVETLRDNSARMEEATKALNTMCQGLMQINHSTRVSESVKAIAFREEDKQSLREVVFEKLKMRDFDGAYEITDEIANHVGYRSLAEELRRQVDAYRDATEEQRIDQAIAHIETLFKSNQWPKASLQIETLIKEHPHSEKARAMRQVLVDRKEQHKKELMKLWDQAVQRQETDRSLEILKELDMYLTPSEGLALQEAAKDVFKNKLHNLGVRFSVAVSDKQWANALDVGQQIIHDFPNSRMGAEIREKLDVLRQNVQLQHT